MLTVGSLFAGIGGFDLGFSQAGLAPTWAVEIDPDCRRVLAHHWPGVLLLEDVRECGKHNLPPVDVICGGFPCQDLSVAGKRAGLGGERSGLFYEMTRIIDELRPQLLVWENVPGLLNSFTAVNPPPPDAPEGSEWEMDEDSDFEAVLCELHRIGFHHGGWTSLDARWFGVAQRRRRVFGVFARADVGAECCAEILSLAHRSSWHSETSGEEEPGVAPSVTPGARRASGNRAGEQLLSGILGATGNGRGWNDDLDRAGAFVVSDKGNSTWVEGRPTESASDENGTNHLVAHTLRAEGCDASEDGTGRGTPLAVVPIDMRQASRGAKMTNNRRAGSSGGAPGTGVGEDGEDSPTIAGSHTPAVAFIDAYACRGSSSPNQHPVSGEGVSDALDTTGPGAVAFKESQSGTREDMMVRRLTPLECCRLQGFPDDWLDLESSLSDSAKYRMLGNAVCVNVARWLGRRIAVAYTRNRRKEF